MKSRKIILTVAIMIVMIFTISISQSVFATTATTPKYLGITEIRTNDTPNFGYAIGDPNANGTSGNAAKIWSILEYTGEGDSASLKADGNKNIYCLKAGIGFSDIRKKATYNVFYDMKTEKEAIKAQNEVLASIVDGTVPYGEGTVSKYNALLALGDMLHLIDSSTDAEKTALLEAAGINSERYNVLMTRDDISAVQQAAIWYFTNYGEENNKYDKTSNTDWLNYTTDGNSYTSLSDYKRQDGDDGLQRQQQAELLYKYLINTAKANASNYSSSVTTGAPAKVITTKLNYTQSGSNYIVGPIRIDNVEGNNIPYNIDFHTNKSTYKLLNSNKQEVREGTTVKDLVGQDFYISLSDIENLEVSIDINYTNNTLTLWASTTNNQEQPVMIPERKAETEPVKLTLDAKPFDLALRKYITKVNGVDVRNTRVPSIDESTLSSGTTATYKHRKDPVSIETGDIVTYNITIYNEGEKIGRATQVIDQLPTGLQFERVVSGNFVADNSYSEAGNNKLILNRKADNEDNLAAYTQGHLSSETIEIECKVIATPDTTNKKVLTNVAWISEEIDGETGTVITNQEGLDRDSEPATHPDVNKDNMSDYKGNGNKESLEDSDYYYKGQQDDDDFEKLILEPQAFDLKLIKNITEVNGQAVTERLKSIDVSRLNITGSTETTATYDMDKTPISVSKGDIVTYRLRVYNEGTLDGYASEITEDIPEGLEFLWSEKEGSELEADTTLTNAEKEAIAFNQQYLWGKFQYNDSRDKITQISSDYLSKAKEATEGNNLIKAFGKNDGTKTANDLSSKEIFVKMKVVSENATGATIRNEACISEDSDKNGNEIDDRDSNPKQWVKYEDDEDFDNIILKPFDLALRKFIIAVSNDETIEDSEYLKDSNGLYTRAPIVDTSKLNTLDENGKMITTATYNHTKEPVLVQKNNIVIYMLRVYNEGDIDGYAAEIKDHLPSYLEFVDGTYNKQYGWTISEDGRTVTTKYLENEKISAAKNAAQMIGGGYELSYKEVPIMCKVKDTAKTNENITNIADITKYLDEDKKPVTDRDSQEDNVNLPDDKDLPGYKGDEKGSYIPGQQDDDDFEKVVVKEFDLALRKWVTQAIVIENNGQTVTETGHQPYDDPEQVVKVELNRKKLNQVTVKFRYSIRIVNEGDIAGYAKEITDYVPQGLKFVAEDNPGWTDEGNNVISTRLLENTLLQPGEFADIDVLLTWVNSQDNMGVMVNTAEISEDYNEYGVPDRDSIPDNQKWGEDDIDDAPVMLSISTGKAITYFGLGFVILVTTAGGVMLIKKYVL